MRLLKRYPELFMLFLYNSGIFIWLQTTGTAFLEKIGARGLGEDFLFQLPQPIQLWIGSHLESISGFLQTSAWTWLVVSMALLAFIRFVKGLIKWLLIFLLVGAGLYLFWQNKELLDAVVR